MHHLASLKDSNQPTDQLQKKQKATTINHEIKIIFQNDCNAGIQRIGKVYSLQLGLHLLSILTEEEKEKFSPLVEALNADYKVRWNFTAEEQALLDAMLQENDGSADFDTIEVIIEMWMERNNKE